VGYLNEAWEVYIREAEVKDVDKERKDKKNKAGVIEINANGS
jgi:hypothetical protein